MNEPEENGSSWEAIVVGVILIISVLSFLAAESLIR